MNTILPENKPILKNFIVLILITLGIATSAIAKDVVDIQDRTLPTDGINLLNAATIDGDFVIHNHDKNEVLLRIRREIRNESMEVADKALQVLKTKFEQDGDKILIQLDIPKNPREWEKLTGKKHIRYSMDYELWIPESLNLNLKTVDGDISIEGSSGNSHLSTVDGDISIVTSGKFQTQVVDGDISVELIAQPGDNCQAKAVDGDVHIKIAPGLAVDIKTQSIDGDIHMGLSLDNQVSTGGQIVGSRNGGGDDILIRTVDGDIHVR